MEYQGTSTVKFETYFFHPVSQTAPSGAGGSYSRHTVLFISLTLESFHLFAPSHLFISLSLFPPKSKRVDASYSNGEISQGSLRHPPAEGGGWVCLFSLFAQPLVCIKIPHTSHFHPHLLCDLRTSGPAVFYVQVWTPNAMLPPQSALISDWKKACSPPSTHAALVFHGLNSNVTSQLLPSKGWRTNWIVDVDTSKTVSFAITGSQMRSNLVSWMS